MMLENRQTAIECGPSMARQSMKGETDINNIMARYKTSGFITHVQNRTPVYADVSDVRDYREAIERVRNTESFFKGLPAKVRAEFDNDPIAFLDFMADPANRQTAEEMGLVPKPAEPFVDEIPGPGIQARNAETGRAESPPK